MRQFSPDFAAHIASGATTLCWCWRITRQDGTRLGFTDHDRAIAFDATTFEAASGFSSSEITESLGLSVDNLEVQSAISSDRLAEADLASGAYDNADVEIFRVNWAEPSQRALVKAGSLGEVRRAGHAFAAEVRGLSHFLNQPKGRLFQYGCDADVGDPRCGIDLTLPAYRGLGTVVAIESARRFTASGLGDYASGFFARGLLTFTSGAANGQAIEVKGHTIVDTTATIELWAPARLPLSAGQTFRITAGCDKHLATCQAKFSNVVNFRGFPHMPGNDFIMRGPR